MNFLWLKYLLVVCLLAIYVNRGLFVSAPGTEVFCEQPAGSGEINSVIEFFHWMISGHENGIDEDGNSPESYHFAKLAQSLVDPGQVHAIELHKPVACMQKIVFQVVEILSSSSPYGTIDHPPERM